MGSMAKNRDPKSQLTEVSFVCSCRHKFTDQPERIEDAPERGHPFLYFASCPVCGDEAEQVPWEKALMASYGKHTGPKTPEGKAATAQNVAGHPTPEEAMRTRFNAMKHGLAARVARYFPAKPGSYPHCKNCDIDWDVCRGNVACMRRSELFMRHQIAFETGDPKLLNDIRSDFHASVQAIIDDMVLAIASDGVTIRNPAYTVKDGEIKIGRYIDESGHERLIYDELSAHPLLKILSEFISRNGLSLSDMDMTPKTVTETPDQMGNLSDKQSEPGQMLEYQREQTRQLEALRDMIARSDQRRGNDPVLIEHGTDG